MLISTGCLLPPTTYISLSLNDRQVIITKMEGQFRNRTPRPPPINSFSQHCPLRKTVGIRIESRETLIPIMSTVLSIDTQREGAEIYHGEEMCTKKSMELLELVHLPRGLLPLPELEEVGYNRETGFVWLKQKKGTNHTFKKIGRQVSYAPEVTAFVEDRRMKKITGVKSKELLIWVTLTDMYIDDPASGKITFKTPTGLFRSFPVSAFEPEGENEKKGKEERKN
ncbi:hypothetical protein AXF42_Ash003009 [Apostasia shenzhenica]|uniref:DUF538 domain-containing protein n=1 Tax=Apostasia shenzhenica TaxID=1088818 RepID=A0A2I0A7X0_9ASPA|nr:hypothetical protein AXF42_Ash003009 [Apostasia shenzhenica]